MISKRTIFFGAVVLILAAVLISNLVAKRAHCGSLGQVKTTGAVVALKQHLRDSPCGASATGAGTEQLSVGLLFFSVLAAGASLAADLRAWHNAGLGD